MRKVKVGNMIEDHLHREYIEICKELVDHINHKEDIIELMAKYIANYVEDNYNICSENKRRKCKHRECEKCVRNYFERKYEWKRKR